MSAIQQMMMSSGGGVLPTAWNPLDAGPDWSFTGGGLVATKTASAWEIVRATNGKASGKWYWEITLGTVSSTRVGIATSSASLTLRLGADVGGYAYLQTGDKSNNASIVAYGLAFASSDVIGVALDMTGGTVTFLWNNASQGVAYTGLSGTLYPALSIFDSGFSATANFGATAFNYTPPTGFIAFG